MSWSVMDDDSNVSVVLLAHTHFGTELTISNGNSKIDAML